MTWPAGDPDAVAHDLLRDGRYGTAATTVATTPSDPWKPVEDWLDDHLWHPLHALLRALGNALNAGHDVGAFLGYVIDGCFIALVVALLVRTVLAFTGRKRPAGAAGVPIFDEAGSLPDWRRRANDAAARGDHAAAIAALFRAALAALDDSAVIAFDGARTPGEYRRMVRRVRPAGSPSFDDLAEGFVRATYAPEPPGRAEFDAAERALAAFEPALGA